MSNIQKTTIVFPIRGDEVLLGMKKRGFGEGWWNGFGGKLEKRESLEDNARRETLEEVGIRIAGLHLVGRLAFYFEDEAGEDHLQVVSAVFLSTDFEGEPSETEEMRPRWFKRSALPLDQMWDGDREWAPQALAHNLGDEPLSQAVLFDQGKKLKGMHEVTAAEMDEYFEQAA